MVADGNASGHVCLSAMFML